MTAIMRTMFCNFLALAWSFAATADEIVLQRGSQFSLYTPSTCRKIEQDIFALALDCRLQGKKVRFYLKEFPGQLGDEFDPRKNPPSRENEDLYTKAALRSIIDELDLDLSPHIKMFLTGSLTPSDTATLWQDGYISSANSSDGVKRIATCLSLRVLTYRLVGVSAVLVSLSENDGLSRFGALKCLGVPGDVHTILGSLGRISDGFRFVRPP